MSSIVIRYGLIAGAVIIGSIIIGLLMDTDQQHVAGLEWLGYLVMIAAFTLIFFGIKAHRDRELGGVIRFGTAFLTGLGITLVAAAVYVVAWEANLAVTDYAFIEEYTAAELDKLAAAGASESEIAAQAAEYETMKENYSKLPYRLFITFMEIFPVGLLITLVSAAVLRRSDVLPDPEAALER